MYFLFKENPKESRCLGVFGLSLYTQERDLRDMFGKWGPVDEVQIVYDHQTGRSRGFAFVYMHSVEDARDVSKLQNWENLLTNRYNGTLFSMGNC